jgi:hypothetical protein
MFRLISHIILSGLILLSLTGLTINLHYCQETLYDIALNSPAESCCENGAHDHHCHPDPDMENSNHCDDETVKVESTDVYFVSSYSFDFDDVHHINLLFATQLLPENQRTANKTESEVFNYKKPPMLPEVVLSQIQSFLI